jgi:hypothetical protein
MGVDETSSRTLGEPGVELQVSWWWGARDSNPEPMD